jgi:hypothetical protein
LGVQYSMHIYILRTGKTINQLRIVFYETSLSSIPIKEEAWTCTIVHTASTLYK